MSQADSSVFQNRYCAGAQTVATMQKTNNHSDKIPDFTLILDIKERIDAICTFAKANRNILPSECLKLGENARLLALQHEYKEGLISALIINAYQHWHLSQYDVASQELDQSESLQHELQFYNELGEFAMVRAMIYWGKGNYEKAMSVLFDTLRTLEKHKIENEKGRVYWVLGVFNYDLKDYDKSLLFYQKALKSFNNFEVIDPGAFPYTLIGLGCCHNRKGNIRDAEKYFKEALEMSIRHNLWMQEARALYEIGMMFFGDNKFQEAEIYLQKSYEMRKAHGTKPSMVTSLMALSDVKIACNQIPSAMQILEEALAISTEINAKTKIYQCHEKLANLYKQIENFKEAIRHIELFYQIRSEVVGEEASNKLKNLETNYATEKAEQEADVERLRNVELKKAHDLIAEKNKEILDSIQYAKRIQDAILPSMTSMQQTLRNSFVLYKPKDVVAGDFYWMEQYNDKIYFAAADCTGHGVPGAMVSVVCSHALSKALLEENITKTGKLLDRTRELVINRLAKSGEEVKDGMDISLCSIDFNSLTLQWSGANNPLWIIRNGELIEYKHDKQAIGVQDNAKPFTTHTIEVQKNDMLYIFTDGYQDQFGGAKGKKFKPSQLKEKLLAIHNQNMHEQKQYLDNFIENWKAGEEQIDDILVIGVRL